MCGLKKFVFEVFVYFFSESFKLWAYQLDLISQKAERQGGDVYGIKIISLGTT